MRGGILTIYIVISPSAAAGRGAESPHGRRAAPAAAARARRGGGPPSHRHNAVCRYKRGRAKAPPPARRAGPAPWRGRPRGLCGHEMPSIWGRRAPRTGAADGLRAPRGPAPRPETAGKPPDTTDRLGLCSRITRLAARPRGRSLPLQARLAAVFTALPPPDTREARHACAPAPYKPRQIRQHVVLMPSHRTGECELNTADPRGAGHDGASH